MTRPTFDEVYRRLQAKGAASVRSSIGTPYNLTANVGRTGRLVIIARPRSGQVRIHEDCWGEDVTCKRTRAGGIYNGSPSVYDWYRGT
jgi:hypothetical protein